MNNIRILIADDHAIVRMGLSTLLGTQTGLEVVGEASNGEAAVARALKLKPDVIVMDLMMPKLNGVAAMTEIRRQLPTCKCLILTSFGTAAELQEAARKGAAGILLKSTANSKLVAAIRKIVTGKTVIAGDVGPMLTAEPPVQGLSPRQNEILDSISRGMSNNQIALQLGISSESVKTHMTKLFEKLGAANRSEAVAIALRRHLLKV